MAMLAEALALLQRETGELWGRASHRRQAKESPAEHIPALLDRCFNPLNMKSFPGELAGNIGERLLKSSIGKASALVLMASTLSIRALISILRAM